MPVCLHVPYNEKDAAKKIGAFWDSSRKVWYVPNGKDFSPFSKWIDDRFSLIVPNPYFASSHTHCWKCKKETPVAAFAANGFYRYDVHYDNDDNETVSWRKEDYFSFFSHPSVFSKEAVEFIKNYFPLLRYAYSNTLEDKYWINHCQSCKAIQGDWFNHEEPDGAFFPQDELGYAKIKLFQVPSHFHLMLAANSGFSSNSDEMFTAFEKKEATEIEAFLKG